MTYPEIIKYAKKLQISGVKPNDICVDLNSKELFTPQGFPWRPGPLGAVLKKYTELPVKTKMQLEPARVKITLTPEMVLNETITRIRNSNMHIELAVPLMAILNNVLLGKEYENV